METSTSKTVPMPTASSRTGVHSYAHLPPYAHPPRRVNCKPYFKQRQSRVGTGPWNVPDLCAAYNWPTGLAGDGVIAIVELGGGWVQSDMDHFFRNSPGTELVTPP